MWCASLFCTECNQPSAKSVDQCAQFWFQTNLQLLVLTAQVMCNAFVCTTPSNAIVKLCVANVCGFFAVGDVLCNAISTQVPRRQHRRQLLSIHHRRASQNCSFRHLTFSPRLVLLARMLLTILLILLFCCCQCICFWLKKHFD